MEGKYIFALIVLGVFFLLIFVSFALLEYGRIKEEKLQSWIDEQYDSKEVKKYDYDTEDENDLFSEQKAEAVSEEVSDIVEEVPENVTIEDVYGKIDVEGIEEITGNYKGDK